MTEGWPPHAPADAEFAAHPVCAGGGGEAVCAVVVSYQPDLQCLGRLLEACRCQVGGVVLVDNGSDASIVAALKAWQGGNGLTLLLLGENLGVATAQNRGAEWARAHDFQFVMFFDQDSVPAPDMTLKLLVAWSSLTREGLEVAAVGPVLLDRRTRQATPFVNIGLFGVRRIGCVSGGTNLVATDFLVSSGMLVALTALERVGGLEDGLFIDNVDLEWCFRARAKGLALYGVCDALMEHSVGDAVMRFGPGVIHRHGPLRQYYIMRNRILLYRRVYSPWGWVVQDFFRMLFKFVVFSLFLGPRRENLRMMLRGVVDGLSGATGRLR